MMHLLGGLLVKYLKSKLDLELAKKTPIGSTIPVKGIAHGIRVEGMEFEADAILRRTK